MSGLTSEQVMKLIAEGETDQVEFKTRLASDASVAAVYSAFSNSNGGILLLGVKDPSEVTGVAPEDLQPTLERLSGIANSMLPTPGDIGVVDIGNKHVVYAIIERAPVEYRPVLSSSGLAFQRRYGSSDIVPTAEFYPPLTREMIENASGQRKAKVLVAMSFRDEEEPHLQDYFNAMVRAAQDTGLPLDITRIDLVEGDYEISQKIMDRIDSADIVIADFTLNPSNVYCELGYARGTKTRVVQTARKGTPLEFDVRNWRTTFYRNATELQEKLGPELRAAYAELTSTGGAT